MNQKIPARVRWLARVSRKCSKCQASQTKGRVLIISSDLQSHDSVAVCEQCMDSIDLKAVAMLVAFLGGHTSGKRVYRVQERLDRILQKVKTPPWVNIPVTWKGSSEKMAQSAEVIPFVLRHSKKSKNLTKNRR